MIIAMFLAHLVGDFILQWDRLAQWKSRALQGVLAHGAIIFAVTWLFAWPFAPGWWSGILFISFAHLAIDISQLYFKPPIAPLFRFLIDQLLHFLVIIIALTAGGFIQFQGAAAQGQDLPVDQQYLLILLGYAFLTMPAWVLLKFLGYALINGSPPNFIDGNSKYLGIAERVLVTTFILMGQFILVPLAALPRFLLDHRRPARKDGRPIQLFELIAGGALAVIIGLALRLV